MYEKLAQKKLEKKNDRFQWLNRQEFATGNILINFLIRYQVRRNIIVLKNYDA